MRPANLIQTEGGGGVHPTTGQVVAVALGTSTGRWTESSIGLEYRADPQRHRSGETNTEHGGRGVYVLDPAGHYIELITQPYI
jgi:hypothetical protein